MGWGFEVGWGGVYNGKGVVEMPILVHTMLVGFVEAISLVVKWFLGLCAFKMLGVRV